MKCFGASLLSFYTVLTSIQFSGRCVAREKTDTGPSVSLTTFDHSPANLFYFDDSSIVLLHDRENGKVYISEDGGKDWTPEKQIKKAVDAFPHPYHNNIAYVIDVEKHIWITYDRGKSWDRRKTHIEPLVSPLSFHATNSRKLLFRGQECPGILCEEVTYYTTDGFESVRKLRDNTQQCVFAHSTPQLSKGNTDLSDRILCVIRTSIFSKDHRLLVSDDYFHNEQEPRLDKGRTVQGIISVAAVKGYVVTAAKAESTDELALYVTGDGDTWHRAIFPHDHKLEEDAYTVLESTNYSIQVNVKTTRREPMGVLFTSNSNGTYFTRNIEHVNRDMAGTVDFEKIQGIQGIVMVNIVDNWEAVERGTAEKKLQTKISFDDGRSFESLKTREDSLHLHSVTNMANVGKVFSSFAPGLVMGVGNTGHDLRPYDEGNLWVSDDAGRTWSLGLEEAHKFEFGDSGSVLLAIYDEGPTNEIRWSVNHGKVWNTTKLGDGSEVKAQLLMTTPDSTTLKFLLYGTVRHGSSIEHVIYSIDFNGLLERTCAEDDFEEWHARVDEEGQPGCVMGVTQSFRRRRKDADCFVMEKYHEPIPKTNPCPCKREDFECDVDYIRNSEGDTCDPANGIDIPKGDCEKPDGVFKTNSGFRLIPGDACSRTAKGAVELDQDIERPCKGDSKVAPSGKVAHKVTSFKADRFEEYFYLERTESSSGDDETVVFRDDQQQVWLSKDHGKKWDRVLAGEKIQLIRPHPYFNDFVYFHTTGKKTHYSPDRGDTFDSFEAEDNPFKADEPNPDYGRTLGFHADKKDWLIWLGVDCDKHDKCHTIAKFSEDRGDHWRTLLRHVRRCEFIKKEGRGESEKLVYCEQYHNTDEQGDLQLKSSDNWFEEEKLHFGNIVDFATMSEFIIVVVKTKDDHDASKVSASVDGQTFADAQWPPNFKVPTEKAYTVLDSSTHAAFLLVTVSNKQDSEYGSIFKSNSNGTSYVLSIDSVNRDSRGFADFEKMQIIEGVALINVVDNVGEAQKGDAKKLKTLITHNDGAQWAALKAPEADSNGDNFDCNIEDVDHCSLHLHGYTERRDRRHTYSSSSAVGLIMGVGNVGSHLTRKADGDLFMSPDGGITWNELRKGPYMWEYGDQGSVIVIVDEKQRTNSISYSLDEGKTWIDYTFAESDEKMAIRSISTVPSDSSLNFLLWAESGGNIKTVNLDFSGLSQRQDECALDEDKPYSDYKLWKPRHPLQHDDCLFGHVTQYHRKKITADCYNGRRYEKIHAVGRNCTCTDQDFEW